MGKEIKLLIVDDESTTRNGLKKHVAWEKLEISEIQCAESGNAALLLCENYYPDIVLSDIRMPGMDGILLCRELRQRFPHCQILFLSGYSDKEYLKAAIDLQAVGYIEKPIDPLEVEHMVGKAIQAFNRNYERQLREQALGDNLELLRFRTVKNLILPHEAEEWKKVEKDLRLLNISYEKGMVYRTAIVKSQAGIGNLDKALEKLEVNYFQQERKIQHISAMKDDTHIIIIFGAKSRMELSESSDLMRRLNQITAYDTLEGSRIFIAVGTIVQTISEVPESYQSAVIALQSLFFCGYGQLRIYSEKPGQSLVFDREGFLDAFSLALFQIDRESADRLLHNAYNALRGCDSVMPAVIRAIYMDITNQLLKHRKSWSTAEQDEIWGHLECIETIRGLHEFARELLQRSMSDPAIKSETSLVTRRVISRIRKDYRKEDLTLRELAADAYVTSTYLSNLFKKETGLTIGQYITKVRMEHACRMLARPNCPLAQVAQETGYSDASYFTKIFKKNIGMTPSQYREKISE